MGPQDETGSSIDGDVFASIVDHLEASQETRSRQRRQLLAELRGLIERDEYRVEPESVAESILEESGVFIVWRD